MVTPTPGWHADHYAADELREYDITPAPFVQTAAAMLTDNGAERVLDAACGQGRNLLYLLEAGFDADGIDGSPRAVDLAQKLAKTHGYDASIVTGDIRDTGLPDASYDAIVSVTVLTHFFDTTDVLSEWHRLLRPGGVVIADAATIHDSTLERISTEGTKVGEGKYRYGSGDGMDVRYLASPDPLIQEARAAGLEVVSTDRISWRELGHPGTRPYPHNHDSYLLIAKKPH